MLSRGGTAAFQKVVLKVADLPSPLDASPGDRVIVRETEEVYALNGSTRTWDVVGTIKKIGGRRPEELAAHLDSKENPHGTALGQVVAAGSEADLPQELVLSDKAGKLRTLIRLLKQAGAIRIGPDAGSSNASIWINVGKAGGAALRVVDADGADRLVVEADGSIKSSGSASFKGGIRGPVSLDDLLTVGRVFGPDAPNNGSSADATALEVGSGRVLGEGQPAPIILSVGAPGPRGHHGQRVKVAYITSKGLGVGVEPTEALDVAGNLRLSGRVNGALSPLKTNSLLGAPDARWRLAATSADIEPDADAVAVSIAVEQGHKAPIIMASRRAAGDMFVLDAAGHLGLAAAQPTRTLDVRGSGVAIGSPIGKARVTVADGADGDVHVAFNVAADGAVEDAAYASWSVRPGGKRDLFEVARRAKDGVWRALLQLNEHGLWLNGDLTLTGAIKTLLPLMVSQVHGLSAANGLSFNQAGSAIDYYAKNGLGSGALHRFSGVWNGAGQQLSGLLLEVKDQGSGVESSLLRLVCDEKPVFDVRKDGSILGSALGSKAAPLHSAFVRVLDLGATRLTAGGLTSDGDLALTPGSGVVRVGTRLVMADSAELQAGADSIRLNGDCPITIDASAESPGLDFGGEHSSIRGIGHIETGAPVLTASRPGLRVKQRWLGSNRFEAHVVDIESDSAAQDSTLSAYKLNGKLLLALYKDELAVAAAMNVNGMMLDSVQEQVLLTSERTFTKFKLPAGVKVEAVVIKVMDPITGVSFFQVGDAVTPDRFAGPSTKLDAGAVTKGLNHCDRGQAVQHVEAALAITTDRAPSGGKVLVTAYFMNPKGQD